MKKNSLGYIGFLGLSGLFGFYNVWLFCVMMPEGLISLGNVLNEDIESVASNPILGFLFGMKPPGSYSGCDFCKYNVFCPFCLYRGICAAQENENCELWKHPTLGEHVNTSYLGRYSCSMARTMFQR